MIRMATEAFVVLQRSFYGWLLMVLLGAPLLAQDVFDPTDPMDDDELTGIEVGARIPDFRAIDQNGKAWDFDALKGPNGAVLLFHRSADW